MDFKQSILPLSLSLWILMDFKQSIFPLSPSLCGYWWISNNQSSPSLPLFVDIGGFQTINLPPLSLSLWILMDFKQSIFPLSPSICGYWWISNNQYSPSLPLFVDVDGIQAINLPSLSLFVDIGGFQTINLPLSLCGY